jgi:hypothetical protein
MKKHSEVWWISAEEVVQMQVGSTERGSNHASRPRLRLRLTACNNDLRTTFHHKLYPNIEKTLRF